MNADFPTGALSSLTAAELKVAVAVGQGRSNREAAETLFLSTKTIDHHLVHIYRKLALRSRSELAVLVTQTLDGRDRLEQVDVTDDELAFLAALREQPSVPRLQDRDSSLSVFDGDAPES